MAKIVSANLDKTTEKIFKRINKIRNYGWFSRDVQEMLEKKYGSEEAEILATINELQAKRDLIEIELKNYAIRLSKIRKKQ